MAAAAPGSAPSVAVVVPAYRPQLTPEEEISVRHLHRHLSRYDVHLVLPVGVDPPLEGHPIKRFDARFFGSRAAYSFLLRSRHFYSAFADYEFILIYQLDALVFRDELAMWAGRGYDFIGAPWTRRANGRPYFTAVGNGGLSLRRVDAALRVLERARSPRGRLKLAGSVSRIVAPRIRRHPRRALAILRTFYFVEDIFFAYEAPRVDASFRIPPPAEAVAFAFETEPRFCFEQNGRRLPFGCHNWPRHDRAFWEPYLIRDG